MKNNRDRFPTLGEAIVVKAKNKVIFSSTKFIGFLKGEGIRKVKIGYEFELVRVEDYVVSKITTSEVKGIVMNSAKKLKDDTITDYILNKTTLFSMKYLDAVETIDLKMHRDSPGKSYFYFKNGVVQVTDEGIEHPIPYGDFKRLVWNDHILEREFNASIDIEANPPVFENFINKLSNLEKDRFLRICTIIGFCLHDYKTSASSRAIIINDEIVSSNPEGGSGKSLIVDALSKIRKTVYYDGKNFDPTAVFAWQKINESIRLVCIDDAKRGFNFEGLFSIITSGFRNINKKKKDEVELPVEDSPTIIITTNNILKGGSGSFARRQHQVEVAQYFNKNHTPIDEYENPFFSGWDIVEWQRFDHFMLTCTQMFLKLGVTECSEENSQMKQLIRNTNQSFAEWMEDNLSLMISPLGVGTIEMRDRFLNDANQKVSAISDRKFTDYMKDYCKIYSYQFQSLTNRRPRGFRIIINDN